MISASTGMLFFNSARRVVGQSLLIRYTSFTRSFFGLDLFGCELGLGTK